MSGSRGLSLAEVLIATAIVASVAALTCALAMNAQAAWRAGSARVDLQQRARVAADALARALHESGAGPLAGPSTGELLRAAPPLVPRRVGLRRPDPFDAFRADAFATLRVVAEAEHGTLLLPAPAGSPAIALAPSCRLSGCGFLPGSTVMLHDFTGNYDLFTVTAIDGFSLTVRHHGPGSPVSYAAGSPAVHVESRSYSLDRPTRILREYDGDASDLPLADDVVGMEVEYWGDVLPPVRPRPPEGQANCLYEADGTYRTSLLPTLGAPGSLVPLAASALTDGPWCGSGANQFDADVLRIRRVRVVLRLQAPDPTVRGPDVTLFAVPGTARESAVMVPDAIVSLDVSPRNLR